LTAVPADQKRIVLFAGVGGSSDNKFRWKVAAMNREAELQSVAFTMKPDPAGPVGSIIDQVRVTDLEVMVGLSFGVLGAADAIEARGSGGRAMLVRTLNDITFAN
jgi:hypothetical protein